MAADNLVDEKKVAATLVDPNLRIVSEKLGTWDLHITVESSFNLQKKLAGVRASIPLLGRLLFDMYRLSPTLFIFFLLSNIWSGVETAFLMHMSNRLLTIIEIGIRYGNTDVYSIFFAVGARVISQVIVGVVQWWADRLIAVLKSRVKYYFELNLIRTKLRADLPTSQDASSKIELTSHGLWSAFEEIMSFLTEIMATASQLALIYHVSRATGGPLFTLLCVAKPFVSTIFQRSLWDKVSLVILTNPFQLRMKALENFMGDSHRPDIITGNLENYVLNEYEKARAKLGDTPNEDPYSQYSRRPLPFFQIGDNILGDLPIIYCALSAIVNPDNFSLASIAILQNSSSHLRYSLQSILMSAERFRQNTNSIKTFYQCLDVDVKSQVPSGHMPYPQSQAGSEKGMAIELKNVCFSYPGSTKTTDALKNVSLSIKSGQLVVIVGANGGGKSTIVKLLSRLYSPTSGELLVDEMPADNYQTSSLRQAIAILSQSSSVFPFSLGENIGVGYPEHVADADMIKRAAEKGGASDFIAKLSTGMETVLNPNLDSYYSFNLYNNIENPLHARMKEIPKKIDISGGEEQRLIAARTFMRFNSGKIKFVAVDEPSSALDAEGELQLFENLIEARAGKTMVFVTHRFGHLTKHADQIICMKDGAVAESGTHDELMSLCGEYAKLYDIQARAFSNPVLV